VSATGLRAWENRFYRLIRHPSAATVAVAPAADAGPESLASSEFCLLVTFRRDGTAVPTPVWFALRDGALVFESDSDAAKIARLRRDPRVRVAACNSRGRPQGPPIDAHARILSAEESEGAEDALARRYGRRRRIAQRLRPGGPAHTYVEVRVPGPTV
jgi:PPOX class probable F420-dependent enzyme